MFQLFGDGVSRIKKHVCDSGGRIACTGEHRNINLRVLCSSLGMSKHCSHPVILMWVRGWPAGVNRCKSRWFGMAPSRFKGKFNQAGEK